MHTSAVGGGIVVVLLLPVGIDQIVIDGLKTKWTTRMTHYIRTLYIAAARGAENNNCERTHYAWLGEQNV